jgi:hypothetical protein
MKKREKELRKTCNIIEALSDYPEQVAVARGLLAALDERDTLAALVREAPVKCPGSAPESCACGANKWLEKAAPWREP